MVKYYLNKIIYFPKHAEIVLIMEFGKSADFWKYRIELFEGKPKLTDYYSFRDEVWASENMKNTIILNSKYLNTSNERTKANRCLYESENYLRNGDTLSALEILYEIPETHLMGNAISYKRLGLALVFDENIFYEALELEKEINPSRYINYLYGYYYGDSIILNNVILELESDLEIKSRVIDSIKVMSYFWQ
jgi:hypothetical protein